MRSEDPVSLSRSWSPAGQGLMAGGADAGPAPQSFDQFVGVASATGPVDQGSQLGPGEPGRLGRRWGRLQRSSCRSRVQARPAAAVEGQQGCWVYSRRWERSRLLTLVPDRVLVGARQPACRTLGKQQEFRCPGRGSQVGDGVEIGQRPGVHDAVEPEPERLPDAGKPLHELGEGAATLFLIGGANPVDADADEVEGSGQRIDQLGCEPVCVRRHGHRDAGAFGGVTGHPGKATVEGGFSASESDAEAALRVQFIDPGAQQASIQHGRGLGCVAERTSQIAGVDQGDRHLAGSTSPLRFRDVDLIEEYVQAGAAVEEMHPVGAGTTLHRQPRITCTSPVHVRLKVWQDSPAPATRPRQYTARGPGPPLHRPLNCRQEGQHPRTLQAFQ
jgi:hypothetical protein